MGSQSGGKAAGCTTADTGLSLPRWRRAGRGPQPETPKPEEHSCVAHVKKRWLLFRTQVGVLTSQSISKLKLFNLLFLTLNSPHTYITMDTMRALKNMKSKQLCCPLVAGHGIDLRCVVSSSRSTRGQSIFLTTNVKLLRGRISVRSYFLRGTLNEDLYGCRRPTGDVPVRGKHFVTGNVKMTVRRNCHPSVLCSMTSSKTPPQKLMVEHW